MYGGCLLCPLHPLLVSSCPPGKVGVLDSSSSTIRARYRHMEDGFPRSIYLSRPIDNIDFEKQVPSSVSWGRFVHEAGWHIELDKLVSSPVAQITKLIQISFISARSRQFLARDRFHLVPISEKLQISPSSWRDLGEILFISPRPQSHYKYRRVIGEISAKSHLSRRDLRDISNLAEFSSRFR